MTATVPLDAVDTFDSVDPATGEVVGTYPIHDADAVSAAVERGRAGAAFWSSLGYAERGHRLRQWGGVLARRMAQLANVVHDEIGKPDADAQLEIAVAIEHITWAAGHARSVLRPRRVRSGLLGANYAASVGYDPLGVVGVIGPWNYPVYTPVGVLAYALAAGNAVVYKPSEHAPGVGAWLVEAFAEVVPEAPVLQLVTGFGPTGEAMCRGGVDKIAFTGSAATGKRVLHACADGLVPALIEGGGKDALLVDADADVAAAADAALWGAMSNAGQTCVGVERAYVHERVYPAFVADIVQRATGLRAGPDSPVGPVTRPAQLAVIRRHIEEGVAAGGRAVVGGPDAVGERFVQPTILLDVPEHVSINTEETFGPVLTIASVPDMQEAVRRANASSYGLAAVVFSRRNGADLARRLDVGMVSINSVVAFTGVPSLPFGGRKQSGFGRTHGADGLREFSSAKSITRRRFRSPAEVTTFARSTGTDRALATLTLLRHGRVSTLPRRRRGLPGRDRATTLG